MKRLMDAGRRMGGLAFAAMALTAMAPMAPALAQSANWNDVVAAAKKEGRVVIYGAAAPETMQRVAAGFRKAYPDIAIEAQQIGRAHV